MILKKPYAFLVKHFRVIHAFLFACALIIFIKFNSIVDFFNNYISSNQKIVGIDDVASKYIDASLTFFMVITLIITGVVMSLMIYKKKPKLFYIYTIIMYTVCLITAFFLSEFLYSIQFETPDLRTVKVIRDIIFTMHLMQIPIMIVAFFRMIGFDLKKFDFKKDLLDLGVEEEDNEEYVLDINIDSEDIKSKIRKRLRYFGYFYKENKLLFVVIGGIIGVIILGYGAFKLATSEKIYREGQTFKTNLLKIEVLDSYKTQLDATGKELSQNNFYLIVKLRYTNNSNNPLTIYTDNALLNYDGKNTITPTMRVSKDLTEFGVNYYSQTLDPHETRDFVLDYEIPIDYFNSSFKLKYLYDSKVVNGGIEYQYRTVKLSPKTFDSKIKKYKAGELGKYLTFEDSILGDTKIRINEIKLSDVFYYNTIKCQKDKCNTIAKMLQAAPNPKFDMTLLRIDYDIVYDYEKLGEGYVNNELIAKYGSIRFEVKGQEYNNRLDLVDVTPYSTGKYVFLEVRDKLKMADKIYLDLNIRDRLYTIVILDKTKEKSE